MDQNITGRSDQPDNPPRFFRVHGPGRCCTCSHHVATQGHHPQCRGGTVTGDGRPNCGDDFVAEVQQAKRRRAAFLTPIKPPAPQHEPGDPWFAAVFKGVIEDVRTRGKGERNTRLRWGARRLGELAHHGHWTKGIAEQSLLAAAQANGVLSEDGERQCRASFDSGWNKGIADPKER